jgi:hypothetical protein
VAHLEDVATATRLALSVRNFPARALDQDMKPEQVGPVLALSDLPAPRQEVGKLKTFEFTSALQFALDTSVSSYADVAERARQQADHPPAPKR